MVDMEIETNRKYIGVEMDTNYYDIAVKRVNNVEPLFNRGWKK